MVGSRVTCEAAPECATQPQDLTPASGLVRRAIAVYASEADLTSTPSAGFISPAISRPASTSTTSTSRSSQSSFSTITTSTGAEPISASIETPVIAVPIGYPSSWAPAITAGVYQPSTSSDGQAASETSPTAPAQYSGSDGFSKRQRQVTIATTVIGKSSAWLDSDTH